MARVRACCVRAREDSKLARSDPFAKDAHCRAEEKSSASRRVRVYRTSTTSRSSTSYPVPPRPSGRIGTDRRRWQPPPIERLGSARSAAEAVEPRRIDSPGALAERAAVGRFSVSIDFPLPAGDSMREPAWLQVRSCDRSRARLLVQRPVERYPASLGTPALQAGAVVR
jgi:hypothetical protein